MAKKKIEHNYVEFIEQYINLDEYTKNEFIELYDIFAEENGLDVDDVFLRDESYYDMANWCLVGQRPLNDEEVAEVAAKAEKARKTAEKRAKRRADKAREKADEDYQTYLALKARYDPTIGN